MRTGRSLYLICTSLAVIAAISLIAFVTPCRALEATDKGATVIDWSKGQVQETDKNCGVFEFRNLQNHQAYSLFVRGRTAATCTFEARNLTFRLPPNFGPTTDGAGTLFSFERFGNDVLVTWLSGY